jgi:hypothetical protein
MKYIFLIATEHHLFQVKAAEKHFSLSKENMILVAMNLGDLPNFIERVKNDTSFSEVHIFDTWIFKDLLLNRNKQQKFIQYCKTLKENKEEYVFLSSQYESDPDLLFLSIVEPKTYYLMDEGTASFRVVNNRDKEHSSFKTKLKFALKSILYFNTISYPRIVTFFTKYNLRIKEGDQLEKYKTLKKNNPFETSIEKEAAFIGTSIADIGMMKEEEYLFYLESIFNENINKEKFYYYPHRKETIEKLQKIENIGFIVESPGIPFETFFGQQIIFPELICSFFTTGVLDNISKSNTHFPSLKVYKFDTQLLSSGKETYDAIYMEMCTNKDLSFEKI